MAGAPEPKISKPFIDDQQITIIQNELEIIKNLNCPILTLLGSFEIDRLRGGIADYVDLITNKKVKVRAKVDIPVEQYPSTNFVGKLLGPGASTLKSIQEQTNTKMTIRGIDNQKQKANTVPDPCEKLHLQIDSLGTPAEAFYKLSHAVAEVQKCLTYNLPMVFPPLDPNNQNSIPMIPEYALGPRAFPSPMRAPMSRGVTSRRMGGNRGGTRMMQVAAPVPTIGPPADWLKQDEPTNGSQDYSCVGPVHSERNVNRLTPY